MTAAVTVPLAARLQGVTLRRAGVVAGLWGEAGIGKTHAAQAVLQALPCRHQTVMASAPPLRVIQGLPRPAKLSAWLTHALDHSLDHLSALPVANLPLLASSLLRANAPFVLLVEDLHEASPEGRKFWQEVALNVQRSRGVGFLLTSRTPLPDEFGAERLISLSRPAADALLEAELGAPLPAEALEWVWRHAAGNPLFTLEYLRFLARHGHLWNDGQVWRWRGPQATLLPSTVEALIEQQLQVARQPQAAAALDALAFLSRPEFTPEPGIWLEVWASVADLGAAHLHAAQQELVGLGVLNEGVLNEGVLDEGALEGGGSSHPQFSHPLFAEVTRQAMNDQTRKTLAGRAVAALDSAPALAAQFVAETGWPPSQMGAVYERAAAACTGIAAARWRAKVAESQPEQAEVAYQAAFDLEQVDPGQALRLARLAWQAKPHHLRYAMYLATRLVSERRRLDDADEVLGTLSDEVRGSQVYLAHLVGLHMGCSDYQGALDIWEQLTAQYGPDQPPATLYAVAGSLAQLRRFDEADHMAELALQNPGLTLAQQLSMLNVRSIACMLSGRASQGQEFFAQATELARAGGLHMQLGTLLQNQAKTLERSADLEQALEAITEAVQAYLAAGDFLRMSTTEVMRANALLECGQFEQALDTLQTQLPLLEQSGANVFQATALSALAWLYHEWRPPHGKVLALKYGLAGLKVARELNHPYALPAALAILASVQAWADQPEQGLETAQEAVDTARPTPDERLCLALAARGRAQRALAQTEEAHLSFTEAQNVAQAAGLQLEVQRIGIDLAALNGNTAQAQQHAAWYKERGLGNGLHLLAREFPELLQEEQARVPESEPSGLRLEALGPLQISTPQGIQPVRGAQRRTLLLLLLEAQMAGRGSVSRLDLIDALYAGQDEHAALSALKVAIHKIRQAHGQTLILTTEGGYALGAGSDVQDFLAGGPVTLWRGPYAGHQLDSELQEALHLALQARIESLLSTHPDQAAKLCALLCEAQPYHLPFLKLRCQALAAAGQAKTLKRIYQQAQSLLARVGERLPADWTALLSP